MPKLTPISSLLIGDVIQIADASPYLSATVSRVDRVEGKVTTVRPFITYHRSIARADHMSPLIGIEEVVFFMSDTRGVMLWERGSKSERDAELEEVRRVERERWNRYVRDIEQNTKALNEGD